MIEDEARARARSTPETASDPARAPNDGKGARASLPPRPPRRIGDACLRALGVALLASVPTGLRTAAAGGAFLDGVLVGAGVLLPIVLASIMLARQAGRGFRQLAGARPPKIA